MEHQPPGFRQRILQVITIRDTRQSLTGGGAGRQVLQEKGEASLAPTRRLTELMD